LEHEWQVLSAVVVNDLEHWWKLEALTPTSGLSLYILIHSWTAARMSIALGSLTSISQEHSGRNLYISHTESYILQMHMYVWAMFEVLPNIFYLLLSSLDVSMNYTKSLLFLDVSIEAKVKYYGVFVIVLLLTLFSCALCVLNFSCFLLSVSLSLCFCLLPVCLLCALLKISQSVSKSINQSFCWWCVGIGHFTVAQTQRRPSTCWPPKLHTVSRLLDCWR